MEKVMWLVLGVTVIVASVFAGRSDRARMVARVALGVLFLVFGAAVNAVYLATDWDSYGDFGQLSQFAFVRDTWAEVVGPNTGLFIGLLIAGEATAGILVLAGGRAERVGLVLLMAFHVGLLFFGWWLWLYAVPMLAALYLLLRAERQAAPTRLAATARHPRASEAPSTTGPSRSSGPTTPAGRS